MSHTYESYSISVLSKFCSRSTICFSVACQSVFKSPLYFFIWRSYSDPSSLGMYTENISDQRIFSSAQISINPFQIHFDTQMLPVYIPDFDARCLSYCYYNCSYYSHSSENSPGSVQFWFKQPRSELKLQISNSSERIYRD